MSDTRLQGQVAIVTGGGRGIGRASALALAGAGAAQKSDNNQQDKDKIAGAGAAGIEQMSLDDDLQPFGVEPQHVAHAAVVGRDGTLTRAARIVGGRRGDVDPAIGLDRVAQLDLVLDGDEISALLTPLLPAHAPVVSAPAIMSDGWPPFLPM